MKNFEEKIRRSLSHPYWLIALGLFPCILTITTHFHSTKKLNRLQEEALQLKEKQQWLQKKVRLEQTLLGQMQQADSAYLEKEIESLQFLQPEMQKIKALLHTQPQNETLQARLAFLQDGQNTLRLRQQNFQRLGKFQEMEAIQEAPVEMNREDLKNLLVKVENVSIDTLKPTGHPPDLRVKNFELIKKPLPSNEEIFLVNIELIKREMLHE